MKKYSGLQARIEKLKEKYLSNLEKIDLSELFICSSSTINSQNYNFENLQNTKSNQLENLKIIVNKADGIKCSHCWKILPNKCNRANCGIS